MPSNDNVIEKVNISGTEYRIRDALGGGMTFDTLAEANAADQAGLIPEGMNVYILNDAGDNIDAGTVGYDNTESGLEAENVQDAVDEVVDDVAGKLDKESNYPVKLISPPARNTIENVCMVNGAVQRNVNIGFDNNNNFFMWDEQIRQNIIKTNIAQNAVTICDVQSALHASGVWHKKAVLTTTLDNGGLALLFATTGMWILSSSGGNLGVASTIYEGGGVTFTKTASQKTLTITSSGNQCWGLIPINGYWTLTTSAS